MLLTRICRPWRDVAVDMPGLWCRLHVDININGVGQEDEEVDDSDWEESDVEFDDNAWQRAAFCYNSWLKRSRGRPLSLVLRRYHSTKLLGNLLQPYANQISSLSIRFLRRVGKPQPLLKDVPALRELVILEMKGPDIQSMAQSISQLPFTMRVLDVMKSPFDMHRLSSLNPVWAHLTQVKITLLHPDAFFHLLHLCPNLSSLTVAAVFGYRRTSESFTHTNTHTNIQSLDIDYTTDSAMILNPLSIFDTLSLPNLRVLKARCLTPVHHKQLRKFFVRSKCPLERLIFGGWAKATDRERAKYVALIPSLDVVVT
ncbi:hypothetical protein DFJ58DRAFT_348358 [Suillus subalutaceus]|uniref:uncharacterized protein n=1 Tax=Suillus subalutaceus TaxID=48586 RepID=UPI001B8716E9|nr:uncharacterized protein DFJ58DRAFT_348358 [Suillus subalutaceus]KAG1827737.1 hypothetical protein DFJ58DRAFT_348358 [Suillus subalutaceus]